MKISKKKIIISLILIFLAVLFMFRNMIACSVIKSRIEKRGGTIKFDEFNIQVFNNAFFFKGEINSLGKNIHVDNMIGQYYPFSIFQSKTHLSSLEITDGSISIANNFYFENFQHMPNVDYLFFKNFLFEFPLKINNEMEKTKILIEEIDIHDWHKEKDFVRFSDLHSYLIWKNIKITVESLDGNEIKLDTGEFSIDLIREYLPSYISIVKAATISIHLTFKYPEEGQDGFFKAQLWRHGITLKEKMELSLSEVLSYPMVKLVVKHMETNDLKSEVFFSKESILNDPSYVLRECNEKMLKDVYLKILK